MKYCVDDTRVGLVSTNKPRFCWACMVLSLCLFFENLLVASLLRDIMAAVCPLQLSWGGHGKRRPTMVWLWGCWQRGSVSYRGCRRDIGGSLLAYPRHLYLSPVVSLYRKSNWATAKRWLDAGCWGCTQHDDCLREVGKCFWLVCNPRHLDNSV